MLEKFSSAVAQIYISYCQKTPNHRGRHKIAQILDGLFGSFNVQSPLGYQLEIYLSSSMDLSYFLKQGVESHALTLKEIKSLKDGDIFVDIGANIGFFSLFASQFVGKSGRVLSYEPSSREFKRLLSNIELNAARNILPYNLALSNDTGAIQFNVSEKSHTGINSIDPGSLGDNDNNIVPTVQGDFLISPFLENRAAVVKIDVEGAEFLVLSGMRSCLEAGNIQSVVIEITPKFLAKFGHTKDDIYELMSHCGFKSTVRSSDWQYDEVFIR